MTDNVKGAASGPAPAEQLLPRFRPQQIESRAPCQVGCAVSGDVRGWIGIVAQRGKSGLSSQEAYASAWQRIVDRNPFPSILGRVCPHPCEPECNRSALDEPVSINAAERFLGDWAIAQALPLRRLEDKVQPEWIGVIGAGPSGLSFAYQMARRGYRVTMYERQEKAGGMLRYGIPRYRLPVAVLDAEIQRILDLGVELRLATAVGQDVALAELRRMHAACYLAIGAQDGRRLGIPGDDAAMSAPDYLGRVSRAEAVQLGRSVTVIGGGNSALDAARTARRAGAEEVTILYRRSREEMPAIGSEVDDALEEGVRIEFLVAPLRLEHRDDALIVTAGRMRLGEADATGRGRPIPIPGSEFEHATDTVIAAVSQAPRWRGLEELVPEGWLVGDDRGVVSDGLWAGGDVLGLGIVGDAVLHGRRAAEALHARLRGQPEPSVDRRLPVSADAILVDFYPTTPRGAPARLRGHAAVLAGDAEVTAGLTEEQFLREVARCFSCGSCFGCEQCAMFCNALSFTPLTARAPGTYFELSLDKCQECGKCIDLCPCRFLRPVTEGPAPAVPTHPT